MLCSFCLCEHNQRELEEEQLSLGHFQNSTCPHEFEESLGDGYCHDELNNAECKYDNGDCCKSPVISNACTKCECLLNDEPEQHHYKLDCPSDLFMLTNDNFCHDRANIPQCDYDGGDCCGFIELTFCTECTCVNPKGQDLPRGGHHILSITFETLILQKQNFFQSL